MTCAAVYRSANRRGRELVCALALACGGDPAAPPPRVVSCDAEITKLLAELGARGDVVGVDHASLGIPGFAEAPDLGAGCELAARAEADRVLALGTPQGIALVSAVEAAGRATLLVAPTSVNEIVATHTRLGALLGREKEASLAVGRLAHDVARIATRRDGRPRLRVVWLLEREPLVAVGSLGLLHEILELAGAENGFHGGSRIERQSVSAEEIAANPPDLVIDSTGVPEPVTLGGKRAVPVDPELARTPTLDVLGRVERLHAVLYGGASESTAKGDVH